MEFEFLSEAIGDLVRQRRKELNLAQADVCRYAHISQGQLSRIENGLRIPSLSLMFRLCRVLNCDISISDIFDKFSSKDKNPKNKKKEDGEKKKGKEGEKS
ncbi:MAG: helix-turn-helix transcriptional regulator [Acetomicrobium sp.]|nr:helix-turn-helix transcriptional regulator [Acetomicrobium sp.]